MFLIMSRVILFCLSFITFVCMFPQICNLGRLSAVGAGLLPNLLYWSIFKFFHYLDLFKDFRIYIADR